MVARVKTVAFQGIDCREVDAEAQLGMGGVPRRGRPAGQGTGQEPGAGARSTSCSSVWRFHAPHYQLMMGCHYVSNSKGKAHGQLGARDN
jgi:hypothetical protein